MHFTHQRLEQLRNVYRDGLLDDTIPFWTSHAVDREYGGFLPFLDADGTVVGTDKPMWTMGRIGWLFSKLYNTVGQRPEWLDLAKHAIDFIRKYGFDADGRMFYLVTRDGRPLRKRRYLFTETFGVAALAEYALATGEQQARDEAKALYRLILKYHTTPGLLEPKGFAQTRQLKSHAMPMILLATTQIIRQIDDDPIYKQIVDDSLDQVQNHFFNDTLNVLLENVGPNGEFLDEPVGREINPGHAIETAWFIMEEARARNDMSLLPGALKIIDASLDIGWDEQFGGLYYFRDAKGLPCPQYEHDLKLWWPHTEALYGTLLAYHLSGQQRYAAWHEKIYDWTYSHFPDREHGEWFGYLHRDGTVSSTLKGNFWKGPFHLPRMQLYCWKLLDTLLAKEG